jgi:hypothetical protein
MSTAPGQRAVDEGGSRRLSNTVQLQIEEMPVESGILAELSVKR